MIGLYYRLRYVIDVEPDFLNLRGFRFGFPTGEAPRFEDYGARDGSTCENSTNAVSVSWEETALEFGTVV